MHLFILQIVLMLSLGTMIYLIARAVPRVNDEVADGIIKRQTKLDYLFSFLWIEKIDPLLHNFLEKFLRKMKFVLMKLDNIASNYLNKVKKYKSGNNGKNGEEKQNLFDGSASLTINPEQGRGIDSSASLTINPEQGRRIDNKIEAGEQESKKKK